MNICFKDGKECKNNLKPKTKKVAIISAPASSYLNTKESQEIEIYGFWQKCIWEKYKYQVERVILPYNSDETLCDSLCSKVLQSEIVVIDLTFKDPHVLSALFLARKNRQPVWLIAHYTSKLYQDFDDSADITIYGDSAEGLRTFRQKLEDFINSLPKIEIIEKTGKPPVKIPIVIPEALKSKVPKSLEVFANDNVPSSKKKDYWSAIVELFKLNDKLSQVDLSNLLKQQGNTVKYNAKDNILSLPLPKKLVSYYERNQHYSRLLFESILFELYKKDIVFYAQTRLILKR